MDEDPVDAIGEAASDVSQSNAFKACMFIVLYSFNFIARQIVGPPLKPPVEKSACNVLVVH